jgi:transcription elongation factor Elf1
MPDDDKGFSCTQCKKRHEYSPYVYAHSNIELVHTCDCGAKHIIIEYKAYPED